MLEVEPEQSSAGSEESLSTKNARLENKVAHLSREREELKRRVAHYEEHTKRLMSVLKKVKGSIDGLAGHSALIGEVLSNGCEDENNEQNEEIVVPEQPQIQAKKKMQTASVLPMVRGFPIRRIIIPLQRLNINSHRHRPNRIHGHRREPWWREAEQEAPEPLQEAAHRPGHAQRVPVRRLQRVERRPHRAVVRPRSRPGARRGQEAAVVERAGAQNRRGGSSHQMLQAVVLLQRLSLTQHQQQQQQRREQESQPLQADNARTPVVMLRDISTNAQTGEESPSEEPAMAASVKAEPAEANSAGPSTRGEAGSPGGSGASAGPSGWTGAAPSTPMGADETAVPTPAPADLASDSHSRDDGAALLDGQEAKVEPCQELPPVLTLAEQGEFTMSAEEAAGEKAAEPLPPALSPFPPCGGGQPAEATDGGGMAPCGEPPPPEAVLSEVVAMEGVANGEREATADTSESDDTSVAQTEPAQLHNGDTTTSGQNEVTHPESSGATSPASAEGSGSVPQRSSTPQKEASTVLTGARSSWTPLQEEPLDYSCRPSSSRKRKASSSVDSPDKNTGSPRSDVEREQSPQSENEQGCRPRRRCAIRTNYALFFAGWNAD